MCIRDRVRSGAALFNPIVGSNVSMMEIIKGVAEVTSGNYKGFTLEELRDLRQQFPEEKFVQLVLKNISKTDKYFEWKTDPDFIQKNMENLIGYAGGY